MNFDHYGYPIFPSDRGYSSCCGDVDRYGKGAAEISGLPRGYDEWRTRSREDEEEEAERKRLLNEAKEEQADAEYDRRKDDQPDRDYRGFPDDPGE